MKLAYIIPALVLALVLLFLSVSNGMAPVRTVPSPNQQKLAMLLSGWFFVALGSYFVSVPDKEKFGHGFVFFGFFVFAMLAIKMTNS